MNIKLVAMWVGGPFDFRVTPNPNLFWMFNLDVEFDNKLSIPEYLLFPFILISVSNKVI